MNELNEVLPGAVPAATTGFAGPADTLVIDPSKDPGCQRIDLTASQSAWLTIDWLPDELAAYAHQNYPALFALHPTERGKVVMLHEEVESPRWHRSYLHLPARGISGDYSYMYAGKSGYDDVTLPPQFQGFLDYLNARETGDPYNQLLVNWYQDGADYIAPHSDCQAGMKPGAGIAVLSLYERDADLRTLVLTTRKVPGAVNDTLYRKVRVKLPHGCIVTMHGAVQTHFRHSVPRDPAVRASRISMTFRKF
jgi:alkylated DNA repair dioxygenase AlkB